MRRKPSRVVTGFTLGLLVLIGGTGCSAGTNSTTTPGGAQSGSTATPTAASPAGVTDSGSAGTGGSTTAQAQTDKTLTIAIPSDISNFDPSTNQLIEYIYAIRNNVFSGLVKYDADLTIVPDLAEPRVDAGGTTYTFALTKGATFQDGTPVDAAAVIASLQSVAAGKSIYASYLAGVRSYSAPDPATVVVTLTKGNAAFLDGLVNIAIVAPQAAGTVGKHPVGSGPYQFDHATANREIVLKRFDGYFGPKPAYARIDMKIVTDPQVAVNNLYSGAVDAVSEVPTSAIKQLNTAKAAAVSPKTSNSIAMFEFNSSGKLKDPRVRQALAYALNKPAIQKIAYGGGGQITGSVIPSGPFATEVAGYSYDLEKAKSLLAAAGASNLSFSVILASGYPEATQAAQVWQSALASIGVTLDIKNQEVSIWVDNYVKRNYDATFNFFNESGDPNSFFNTIMLPHLQDDYQNADMLSKMAAALATTDQKARTATYTTLSNQVNADLPILVIQTRPLAAITAPTVTGLQVNPLGWLLTDAATPAAGR